VRLKKLLLEFWSHCARRLTPLPRLKGRLFFFFTCMLLEPARPPASSRTAYRTLRLSESLPFRVASRPYYIVPFPRRNSFFFLSMGAPPDVLIPSLPEACRFLFSPSARPREARSPRRGALCFLFPLCSHGRLRSWMAMSLATAFRV